MAWAPDYVTVADLEQFVRVPDHLDDTQMDLAITTASRSIDDACGRQFGRLDVAEQRYYTARWNARRGVWAVLIDDLMDGTALTVAIDDGTGTGTYTAVTGYTLGPRNAAGKGWPWTVIYLPDDVTPAVTVDGVRASERWGWLTIPDTIQEATLLQASRLLTRRDAPFGIAGSPQSGSELRLLDKLDPDVVVMTRPYRRGVRPR